MRLCLVRRPVKLDLSFFIYLFFLEWELASSGLKIRAGKLERARFLSMFVCRIRLNLHADETWLVGETSSDIALRVGVPVFVLVLPRVFACLNKREGTRVSMTSRQRRRKKRRRSQSSGESQSIGMTIESPEFVDCSTEFNCYVARSGRTWEPWSTRNAHRFAARDRPVAWAATGRTRARGGNVLTHVVAGEGDMRTQNTGEGRTQANAHAVGMPTLVTSTPVMLACSVVIN